MTKSTVSKKSGFSLIELLVFIAVVGLFSVSTMGLMNASADYYREPMLRMALVQEAQSILEELNLKSYNDIKRHANEKLENRKGVSFAINIVEVGEAFQLSQSEVLLISISASYKETRSFMLSRYRFEY